MVLHEINTDQIKEAFELQTGIHKSNVMEVNDAFPLSMNGTILTQYETYHFKFTEKGNAKSNSFVKEN